MTRTEHLLEYVQGRRFQCPRQRAYTATFETRTLPLPNPRLKGAWNGGSRRRARPVSLSHVQNRKKKQLLHDFWSLTDQLPVDRGSICSLQHVYIYKCLFVHQQIRLTRVNSAPGLKRCIKAFSETTSIVARYNSGMSRRIWSVKVLLGLMLKYYEPMRRCDMN